MIREGRRTLHVPTLAMVDAFVGGVAVILILTILSSLSEERSTALPLADRVITCTGGESVAISGPEGPVATDFTRLARTLAALAPPEALSMRVLIRTPVEGARACIAYVTRALEEANTATDARSLGYPAPIFLIDTEFVEAEDAPE